MGDKTLDSTFQTFKDMQLRAKNKSGYNNDAEEIILPYAYEFYNVFAFTQLGSSGVRSILARVINALVEGLNSRPRLPRYVVVVLDKDIIDEVNVFKPEAAVEKVFWEVTDWLACRIKVLFKRKRLDLSNRNPGAVFGDDPRVIFVKMLRRAEFYPASCKLGKICSVRTKFNDSINMAAAKHDQYVMNISTCTSKSFFDICGNLSDPGKKVFYRELDHLLERFDRNEIQLLPPMPAKSHGKFSKQSKSYNNRY